LLRAGVALPAAASAGTLLASCGGNEGASSNTLEFWAFAEDRLFFVKDVLESDAWKSKHPDVKVNFRVYNITQMHDKLLTALVSGKGAPDIADVAGGFFSKFIKGETMPFVPLTDRIGDEIDKLYTPTATAPYGWGGEIYGVSNELNPVVLAYRKDIMGELGVRTPFETWDDVIVAGEQLVRSSESKMFALHDIDYGDWYMLMQNAGTQFFGDNGEFIADNEAGLASLQFSRDLVYEYEVAGIAAGTPADPWHSPEYMAGYRAEKYVAVLAPPWLLNFFRLDVPGQKGKWTVQKLPEGLGAGRPTANFGGTAHCITEQSENPDLAWDLAKACNLTTQGVLTDFKQRGVFPTYKPAYGASELNKTDEYFSGTNFGELYSSLAPEILNLNTSPVYLEATQELVRTAVGPVMQNQADPKTALNQAAAEIERMRQG